MKNLISIIILNNNSPHLAIHCARSILHFSKKVDFEIIIIDNGSGDNSLKQFKQTFGKNTKVTVIASPTNIGFGKGHNLGFKNSHGNFLFFLNCDIEFHENSLLKLLQEFHRISKRTKIGFLQPQLLHSNNPNDIQITCSTIPTVLNIFQENFPFLREIQKKQFKKFRYSDWNRKTSRFVEATCGAALFCSREFFQKVGVFDPRFFLYFEEYDLSRRTKRLGYKNYFTTKTSLIHLEARWPAPYIRKRLIYISSFLKYLFKWHWNGISS